MTTPLLIALAAFAVHARGFSGSEFTFDDKTIVAANPLLELEQPGDLVPLLTTDYWRRPDGAERLWRPLSLVSLALEKLVHAGSPDAFHRTNAALHALISVGLYGLFLILLGGSHRAAALGASLFALHPVHAEASAGIVGRSELLALGLSLAGWLLHLAARRRRAEGRPRTWLLAYPLAGLCFFLAATSKEIALASPFVLIVLELSLRGGPRARTSRWRAVAPYLLYVCAIGAYAVCRALVLDDLVARTGGRTLGDMAGSGRLLVAGWIYLDSLISLVVPHATSAHYPFGGAWLDPLLQQVGVQQAGFPPHARIPAWSRPLGALPLLLHAGLLALATVGLRGGRRWARAAGAGVWGFYLALGPVSNLLVPIGVVRADRLLYLPSALFALTAAAAGAHLLARRSRKEWCLVAALVLGPYGILLSHNVHTWTHTFPLWQRTVAAYPQEPRGLHGLGLAWLSRGRPAEAAELLARAVELSPPGSQLAAKSRADLGHALMALGRFQEAEQSFVAARQLDSASESASAGLAHLYMSMSERSADPAEQHRLNRLAARAAQEGTRSAGHSYRLWLTLGSALARLPGREVESELAYDRAVELAASPWQALVNRAVIQVRQNDAEGAEADYERVCDLIAGIPPAARDATMWVVLIDSTRARRELGRARDRPAETERARAELRALDDQLGRSELPAGELDALRGHLRQAQR